MFKHSKQAGELENEYIIPKELKKMKKQVADSIGSKHENLILAKVEISFIDIETSNIGVSSNESQLYHVLYNDTDYNQPEEV
jgi:hypothetical protein